MTSATTVCISHGEDADGLICATYMRLLKDATLILATYDELKDALKSVQPPVEEVYICERLNVMAYCETPEGKPIGTVAGLIVDAIGTKVGLCYVVKDDGRVNISLRSKRGLDYHLGKTTREIAEKIGGFGGGHKRASGASIPLSSLDQFIQEFDAQL